ncbi:hypothetical protein F4776DRAFT_106802 [Hypoxylon sp. NC0597]|nr:hypothetical protein F4776DRAFT_106802 [Hypoxylon sp. NC0597]
MTGQRSKHLSSSDTPYLYLTSLLLPLCLWLLTLSHKSWIHSANKKKKEQKKNLYHVELRTAYDQRKQSLSSHDPERATAPVRQGIYQKVLHIL